MGTRKERYMLRENKIEIKNVKNERTGKREKKNEERRKGRKMKM